jgi:hypothetical protein
MRGWYQAGAGFCYCTACHICLALCDAAATVPRRHQAGLVGSLEAGAEVFLSCRERAPWLGAVACWILQPQAVDHEEAALRYVYIGLIVAFTALVVLFKFRNLETVTVSLFPPA